jgi:hypothetical protein
MFAVDWGRVHVEALLGAAGNELMQAGGNVRAQFDDCSCLLVESNRGAEEERAGGCMRIPKLLRVCIEKVKNLTADH